MVIRAVFVGVFLCSLCGCDTDKVRRLEKDNTQLKAELQRQNLDLQSKCSKDSKSWFDQNWSGSDNDKILLEHANHYNSTMNKCFVRVEYHFRTEATGSWANMMSLTDVYENEKYGSFLEMHYMGADYKTSDQVSDCGVLNSKCKSVEEYSTLVQPYMNN